MESKHITIDSKPYYQVMYKLSPLTPPTEVAMVRHGTLVCNFCYSRTGMLSHRNEHVYKCEKLLKVFTFYKPNHWYQNGACAGGRGITKKGV